MIAHLESLVASADPAQAKNVLREYLQARTLLALQRAGAMVPLAFHGGTALRFLFAIGRYSEDLDFALNGPRESFDFQQFLQTVRTHLTDEGYLLDLKVKSTRTVHSALLRFRGLLYQLNLAPRKTQVFSIKIEVDTNPPAGAVLDTTIIRRHALLQLHHHDRASLLAGKLHAALQRPYAKGRDFFDLIWYLSDPTWPTPNFTLLNNALIQSNYAGPKVGEANWRNILADRISRERNWQPIIDDVAPFIEQRADLELLSQDNLLRLLR